MYPPRTAPQLTSIRATDCYHRTVSLVLTLLQSRRDSNYVCASVRACIRVRACVRACVHTCACVRACACMSLHMHESVHMWCVHASAYADIFVRRECCLLLVPP